MYAIRSYYVHRRDQKSRPRRDRTERDQSAVDPPPSHRRAEEAEGNEARADRHRDAVADAAAALELLFRVADRVGDLDLGDVLPLAEGKPRTARLGAQAGFVASLADRPFENPDDDLRPVLGVGFV